LLSLSELRDEFSVIEEVHPFLIFSTNFGLILVNNFGCPILYLTLPELKSKPGGSGSSKASMTSLMR
jgi:hypothetical protein